MYLVGYALDWGTVKLSFEYIYKGGAILKAKSLDQKSLAVARERDEKSGKYTREYDDEEFIEAVELLDMPSTKQVSEEVGCSYTLAYHRLNQLVDEGRLERFEVGNSFAWTLS